MRDFKFAWILALMFAMPAAAADMKPFVSGSWQTILAAHAGKPVIVHFWGLTCAPCLTELPHWAAFKRQRPDLDIVMIAADPAPGDVDDLTKTLRKAGLGDLERWAFADAFAERLRHEIDPKWRGEMPRTLLLDSDGRTTVMVGTADWTAINKWSDSQKGKYP
jgi:thiol-disulfide isomerase/thioredoxin